jgi:hypothetical protein
MRIGGNQSNPDRHPTDLYPTHPAWTQALLAQVTLEGPVWEPAAGNGDMVQVLEDYSYQVRATDILTGTDFLAQTDRWDGSIVTNPPYRHADEFVHKALSLTSAPVAMLLPIGALGGQRRFTQLWAAKPPSRIVVVAKRMPVYGKASQFNHIWAVWNSGSSPTTLHWELGV